MIKFIKDVLADFTNYFIVFIIGAVAGASYIWHVRSKEIEKVTHEYQLFIDHTQEQGELAKKFTDEQISRHKQLKESADEEYKSSLANLNNNIKRLRQARASSSFLPANSTSSRSNEPACFNQSDFERTLQQFDDSTQELITEGDEEIKKLYIIKNWYQLLQ